MDVKADICIGDNVIAGADGFGKCNGRVNSAIASLKKLRWCLAINFPDISAGEFDVFFWLVLLMSWSLSNKRFTAGCSANRAGEAGTRFTIADEMAGSQTKSF